METQILNLKPPYDFIHCNGEVGKHIATMIMYETTKGEDGSLKFETHSFPIVKYSNSPSGVVWNNAELTDCDVICNEERKETDIYFFLRLVRREWGIENDKNYYEKAQSLRHKLIDNDITFVDFGIIKPFRGAVIVTEHTNKVEVVFEEKNGKIICQSNEKGSYPIYCEADTRDELIEKLENLIYDWEHFTDRRVKIHLETEQKEYESVIETIEDERIEWEIDED